MAYDMMRKKGLGFAGGGAQTLNPAPRAGGGAAPMRPAPRMGGGGAGPLSEPYEPTGTFGDGGVEESTYNSRPSNPPQGGEDGYDPTEDRNDAKRALKAALARADGDQATDEAVEQWRAWMRQMGYTDEEIAAIEDEAQNDPDISAGDPDYVPDDWGVEDE